MENNPAKFAEAYNFGPDPKERMNVQELVETAIKIWGSGNYEVSANPNKLHEAGLLRLNIDKSRNELGWEPKYNAKEAVQKTIAWYKATKAEEDIKSFTESQIISFFKD